MYRKLMLFLALTIAASGLLGAARPALAEQPVTVKLEFDFLRQGSAGVIMLTGQNITGATAFVFGRGYPFFPVSQGFACLMSVSIYAQIKDYPMNIVIDTKDGTSTTWEGSLKVAEGQFITETPFVMPSDKRYLLRDDVQQSEDAKLLSTYSLVTQTKYWDGPFTMPANAGLGSPFGSWRSYSGAGGVNRRHTGYDLRAGSGTPVLASANGRVVFSGWLDIHGYNIIIDHGWGVYSEYAHLSQRYVVPGQFVLQGDVLGLSGNTGRSTGPHIHWEIAVNGNWVNPITFMQVKLPN